MARARHGRAHLIAEDAVCQRAFPPTTRRYAAAAARHETSRGNPKSGIPAEIIPRGQARTAINDSLRKHAELLDLHGHASMRPGQLAAQN
jgi:hypothetical protein